MKHNAPMLVNLFRILACFAASMLLTFMLGTQLYKFVSDLKWFMLIPLWALGMAIGFACGFAIPRASVPAIQIGGAVAALLATIGLIIVSMFMALIALVPIFVVYAILQGVAARYGADVRSRYLGI